MSDFSVLVDRLDLLSTMQHNRDVHVDAVAEAQEIWMDMKVAQLKNAYEKATEGEFVRLDHLPEPPSHETDYDRVIGLLGLSGDDLVDLTDRQYQNYVLDDWEWKRQWTEHIAGITEGGCLP